MRKFFVSFGTAEIENRRVQAFATHDFPGSVPSNVFVAKNDAAEIIQSAKRTSARRGAVTGFLTVAMFMGWVYLADRAQKKKMKEQEKGGQE